MMQPTAPAVTLSASAAAFPHAIQPARQPPPWLSLESLGCADLKFASVSGAKWPDDAGVERERIDAQESSVEI